MYATAHRAISEDGLEAIHSFIHIHGDVTWPDEVADWPETHPGKLVLNRTVLPVGGNRVRSYLDILAPDGTPLPKLHSALESLASDLAERRNPTVFKHGTITVRLGVEPTTLDERQSEFSALRTDLEDFLGKFLTETVT